MSDPLGMPLVPPPAGVTPDLENPGNENPMVLSIMSVCLALSTITVVLRFYSRWSVLRKFEAPDFLLLGAFLLYVATLGMYYYRANNGGWFVHMWEASARDVMEFMRIAIYSTCTFVAFMLLMKTAILLEWIRIFLPDGGGRRSYFFWACHVVIWSNVVFCGVTLILVGVTCIPFEYQWDKSIEGGYCPISADGTGLASAVWAFATDVLILFLPQRVIWKLNMSLSRKLGISVVFALGLGACAASIVRLYYAASQSLSDDVTYLFSAVQLTAVGESACAILVMCVPAIPKAIAAMKLHERLSSFASWTRLGSVVRYRSSQRSRNKGTSELSKEHHSKLAQLNSSSERYLVPLEPMPGGRYGDPELGNTIVRSTKFETSENFKDSSSVDAQEYTRQHPWSQR